MITVINFESESNRYVIYTSLIKLSADGPEVSFSYAFAVVGSTVCHGNAAHTSSCRHRNASAVCIYRISNFIDNIRSLLAHSYFNLHLSERICIAAKNGSAISGAKKNIKNDFRKIENDSFFLLYIFHSFFNDTFFNTKLQKQHTSNYLLKSSF